MLNTNELLTAGVNMIDVKLLFEPRDLWIGIYWNKSGHLDAFTHEGAHMYVSKFLLYVCLLPCLPIRITITRERWLKDMVKDANA